MGLELSFVSQTVPHRFCKASKKPNRKKTAENQKEKSKLDDHGKQHRDDPVPSPENILLRHYVTDEHDFYTPPPSAKGSQTPPKEGITDKKKALLE
jgi:hypothetical protein